MLRLVAVLLLGVACEGFSAKNVEFSKTAWNKKLRTLTKENFETIYDWDGWLSENGGATLYAKSMRRLTHLSKSYGVELREDFLANARATAKRRDKQAQYETAKEEARLAKLVECEEQLRGVADSEDLEAIDAAIAAATEAGVPEDFDGWAPARAAKAECERKAAEAEAAEGDAPAEETA